MILSCVMKRKAKLLSALRRERDRSYQSLCGNGATVAMCL